MKTAVYSTRGFITGSSILWIVVISQISLLVMVPFLFMNLHPFIVTGIFIGAIYLGFQMVTGRVKYTIDQDGLTKDMEPNMLKTLWKKKAFQFYSWDQIRNFKAGTDADRSLEQYDYLTIRTNNGEKIEINTKKGDKAAFKAFEETFRYYVSEAAEGHLVDANQPVSARLAGSTASSGSDSTIEKPLKKHVIVEKPNFYQTVFAKVLTIGFSLMLIGLAAAMILLENFRPANIFRLAFIILPGVAYMFWRVYIKKG